MTTHCSMLTWRIPRDRGAWWAAVHGVAKTWTWLRDYTQDSTWLFQPLVEGEPLPQVLGVLVLLILAVVVIATGVAGAVAAAVRPCWVTSPGTLWVPSHHWVHKWAPVHPCPERFLCSVSFHSLSGLWMAGCSSSKNDKLNTEQLGEQPRPHGQQVTEWGFEVTTSDSRTEVFDNNGSQASPERTRKQENQAPRLWMY